MKSAKQRFIDAGYWWVKPENNPPHSARRFLIDLKSQKCWTINSPEEANELADELLGAE